MYKQKMELVKSLQMSVCKLGQSLTQSHKISSDLNEAATQQTGMCLPNHV